MSDNVVDLATRGRRSGPAGAGDRETRAAEAERVRLKRLDDAPGIAAQLRGTPRLGMPDRSAFARNLARMCGEAFRGDRPSLRRVFEAAFGRDFDAKYKKRKRFVCGEEEDAPEEGFAALGADFVNLAEAVATIAHKGQPADAVTQARRRAILQLVAGSSFDDRRTPEARLKDEAVGALLDSFRQIVRRVEAEVDLDAMRTVIGNDSVSAIIDGTGNVERLVEPEDLRDPFEPAQEADESDAAFARRREAHRRKRMHPAERALDEALADHASHGARHDEAAMEQALSALLHLRLRRPNDHPVRLFGHDLDDPGDPRYTAFDSASPFAPRVVIGEVLEPAKISGAMMLDIDEAEIEEALARGEQDYAAAVARHGLAAVAPAFDRERAHHDLLEKAAAKAMAARYGFSDAWIAEECHGLHDLEERMRAVGFAPPDGPWSDIKAHGIVARRQIELKLLRDSATERWRLCLSLSHGPGQGIFGREGVYGMKRPGAPFEPSLCLGLHGEALSPHAGMATLFLHRAGDNRFLLYAVENADLPTGELIGIRMGWLSVQSAQALDAFFAGIEDREIDAPLDRFWNQPAPARPGTLAGMILRNLAYAPDGERYDLRLLEDARAKAAMAQAYAASRRARFDAAIRRLTT